MKDANKEHRGIGPMWMSKPSTHCGWSCRGMQKRSNFVCDCSVRVLMCIGWWIPVWNVVYAVCNEGPFIYWCSSFSLLRMVSVEGGTEGCSSWRITHISAFVRTFVFVAGAMLLSSLSSVHSWHSPAFICVLVDLVGKKTKILLIFKYLHFSTSRYKLKFHYWYLPAV